MRQFLCILALCIVAAQAIHTRKSLRAIDEVCKGRAAVTKDSTGERKELWCRCNKNSVKLVAEDTCQNAGGERESHCVWNKDRKQCVPKTATTQKTISTPAVYPSLTHDTNFYHPFESAKVTTPTKSAGGSTAIAKFEMGKGSVTVMNIHLSGDGPKKGTIHDFLNASGVTEATLKDVDVIAGDSNITPSKCPKCGSDLKHNHDLSKDIATELKKITKEDWTVHMANTLVGKTRSGWSLWNNQIFKSEPAMGDFMPELDGTLVAVRNNKKESLGFEMDKGTFRSSAMEATSGKDVTSAVNKPAFVFANDALSSGDIFLDHAALVFKVHGTSFDVVNMGAVVDVKYKDWGPGMKMFNLFGTNLSDAAVKVSKFDDDLYQAQKKELQKLSKTLAGNGAGGGGTCAGRKNVTKDSVGKDKELWCRCNKNSAKLEAEDTCQDPGGERKDHCVWKKPENGKGECIPKPTPENLKYSASLDKITKPENAKDFWGMGECKNCSKAGGESFASSVVYNSEEQGFINKVADHLKRGLKAHLNAFVDGHALPNKVTALLKDAGWESVLEKQNWEMLAKNSTTKEILPSTMKDVVKATGSFLTKMKISQPFGGFGYYILEKKADLSALKVENIYKRVHKWVEKGHVVVASEASYTEFMKSGGDSSAKLSPVPAAPKAKAEADTAKATPGAPPPVPAAPKAKAEAVKATPGARRPAAGKPSPSIKKTL